MYIPPNSVNMKDVKQAPLFVGIVGAAATGKTTASLTFPNPIHLDIDRSLSKYSGKDLVTIPFYEDQYCVDVLKATRVQGVINKRDLIKSWLRDNCPKFEKEQTLILDSWSSLQEQFDKITALQPEYTKRGEVDEFSPWARKIAYSSEIMTFLQGCSCNVVIIFHELRVRDEKTGELLEKLQPFMQGKFVTTISKYFSDFFRALVIPKLDAKGKPVEIPGVALPNDINYMWQVKADALFDAKSRTEYKAKFIPAHYNSLMI